MVEKCPYSSLNKKLSCFGEDRENINTPNCQTGDFGINPCYDALSVNSTRQSVDLSDNEQAKNKMKNNGNNSSKQSACPFGNGNV